MQCQVAPGRICPSAANCELVGCQQPYGPTGVVKVREPIDLTLQPPEPEVHGRLTRLLMRMTERGEDLVRRGPTPFAAAPDPTPALPAPLPEPPPPAVPEPEIPPVSEPAPITQPTAPAPVPGPGPLRIVAIPGPAFVVYFGDKPLGLVSRIEQLGLAQ